MKLVYTIKLNQYPLRITPHPEKNTAKQCMLKYLNSYLHFKATPYIKKSHDTENIKAKRHEKKTSTDMLPLIEIICVKSVFRNESWIWGNNTSSVKNSELCSMHEDLLAANEQLKPWSMDLRKGFTSACSGFLFVCWSHLWMSSVPDSSLIWCLNQWVQRYFCHWFLLKGTDYSRVSCWKSAEAWRVKGTGTHRGDVRYIRLNN